MMENHEQERRGYFLLKFTEAMIKNSKVADFYRLKEILKLNNMIVEEDYVPEKTVQEQVKEKLQKDKKISKMFKSILPPPREDLFSSRRNERPLRIPIKNPIMKRPPQRIIQRPPKHLQEIRPAATSETIELGKIDSLIKDPNVVTIETSGQNQKIVVTGKMGRQPTGIILTKEDIDEIINRFSKVAKIPTQEGSLKIVYGSLILDANISSEKNSSFIIRKIR